MVRSSYVAYNRLTTLNILLCTRWGVGCVSERFSGVGYKFVGWVTINRSFFLVFEHRDPFGNSVCALA